MWFQGSLLDGATDGPPAEIRRHELARGAWVDHAPGWLGGADDLFLRLQDTVPWRAERREMYDRMVDVPRLICSYGAGDALPDPALAEARDTLNAIYSDELGEEF